MGLPCATISHNAFNVSMFSPSTIWLAHFPPSSSRSHCVYLLLSCRCAEHVSCSESYWFNNDSLIQFHTMYAVESSHSPRTRHRGTATSVASKNNAQRDATSCRVPGRGEGEGNSNVMSRSSLPERGKEGWTRQEHGIARAHAQAPSRAEDPSTRGTGGERRRWSHSRTRRGKGEGNGDVASPSRKVLRKEVSEHGRTLPRLRGTLVSCPDTVSSLGLKLVFLDSLLLPCNRTPYVGQSENMTLFSNSNQC